MKKYIIVCTLLLTMPVIANPNLNHIKYEFDNGSVDLNLITKKNGDRYEITGDGQYIILGKTNKIKKIGISYKELEDDLEIDNLTIFSETENGNRDTLSFSGLVDRSFIDFGAGFGDSFKKQFMSYIYGIKNGEISLEKIEGSDNLFSKIFNKNVPSAYSKILLEKSGDRIIVKKLFSGAEGLYALDAQGVVDLGVSGGKISIPNITLSNLRIVYTGQGALSDYIKNKMGETLITDRIDFLLTKENLSPNQITILSEIYNVIENDSINLKINEMKLHEIFSLFQMFSSK